MSSTQRGLLGSKAQVKCDYCGKTGRKDNVEEHIWKDNLNRNVKVTYIRSQDLKDITTFFKGGLNNTSLNEDDSTHETLEESTENIDGENTSRKRDHNEKYEDEPKQKKNI